MPLDAPSCYHHTGSTDKPLLLHLMEWFTGHWNSHHEQGRLLHTKDGAMYHEKIGGEVFAGTWGGVRKLFMHFPLSFCNKFPLQN